MEVALCSRVHSRHLLRRRRRAIQERRQDYQQLHAQVESSTCSNCLISTHNVNGPPASCHEAPPPPHTTT